MVPGGKPGGNNLTGLLWTYMSEPTPGLNGRSVIVPRGHVLGGSSSISTRMVSNALNLVEYSLPADGMVYTRGSSDDYDNWAELGGDRRWSWKALWPYILRVRSCAPVYITLWLKRNISARTMGASCGREKCDGGI
jgi:choline dehydrogenase-like flavoprotein